MPDIQKIVHTVVEKWLTEEGSVQEDLECALSDAIEQATKSSETEINTVRWHLQCIPSGLDRAVRMRQAKNGRKYICQQVVADLLPLYQKEIEALQ